MTDVNKNQDVSSSRYKAGDYSESDCYEQYEKRLSDTSQEPDELDERVYITEKENQ